MWYANETQEDAYNIDVSQFEVLVLAHICIYFPLLINRDEIIKWNYNFVKNAPADIVNSHPQEFRIIYQMFNIKKYQGY